MSEAIGVGGEQLVAETRERAARRPAGRERLVSLVDGGLLLAVALAWPLLAHGERAVSLVVVAVFVAAYAVASRVEFEIAAGSAVPTQLIFVPLLLVLPAPLVPLCVAAGFVAGNALDYVTRRHHPERALGVAAWAWHAVAPAALLWLAGDPRPSWAHAPLYAALLAAQVGSDLVHSVARERLVLGIHPRVLLRPLGSVYLVDVLLAPVGLLVAFAAADQPLAVLAVVPLLALLALFARERAARIDHEIALRDERDANQRLDRLARCDGLTGVANRRSWNEELPVLLERARRDGQRLCVALLDLDHFKHFNDSHGHVAGDALLGEAAGAWTAQLRGGDLLARYGGEEFAVALPACTLDHATRLGDRLRRATPQGQTCSVGVAEWDGSEDAVALVERADRALYAAKQAGRDRIARAPRRTLSVR